MHFVLFQNIPDQAHDATPKKTTVCCYLKAFFKAFVMTFILKFLLGFSDVVLDFIAGINFLAGTYGLSLYFIAGVRSDYAETDYGQHELFGMLTLSVIWIPGILRVALMALDTKWRKHSLCDKLLLALFLTVMAAAWPLFNVFW